MTDDQGRIAPSSKKAGKATFTSQDGGYSDQILATEAGAQAAVYAATNKVRDEFKSADAKIKEDLSTDIKEVDDKIGSKTVAEQIKEATTFQADSYKILTTDSNGEKIHVSDRKAGGASLADEPSDKVLATEQAVSVVGKNINERVNQELLKKLDLIASKDTIGTEYEKEYGYGDDKDRVLVTQVGNGTRKIQSGPYSVSKKSLAIDNQNYPIISDSDFFAGIDSSLETIIPNVAQVNNAVKFQSIDKNGHGTQLSQFTTVKDDSHLGKFTDNNFYYPTGLTVCEDHSGISYNTGGKIHKIEINDEKVEDEVVWSSKKTQEEIIAAATPIDDTAIGVRFTKNDNEPWKAERLGQAVGKNPGADFNEFNMYGSRELGFTMFGNNFCPYTEYLKCAAFGESIGVDDEHYAEMQESKWSQYCRYKDDAYHPKELTVPANTEFVVKQPEFYYRVRLLNDYGFELFLSDTELPGFKKTGGFNIDRHPVVIDTVSNNFMAGVCNSDLDESTYKMAVNKSAVSYTPDNILNNLTLASELYNIEVLTATQMLFLVEYATLDVQEAIGDGVVYETHPSPNDRIDYVRDDPTKFYDELKDTFGTGRSTGEKATSNNEKKSGHWNYRWEKDLWGGPYKTFVDGIRITPRDATGLYKMYKALYNSFLSNQDRPTFSRNYAYIGDFYKEDTSSSLTNYFNNPQYFDRQMLSSSGVFIPQLTTYDTNYSTSIKDITAFYGNTNSQLGLFIGNVYNCGTSVTAINFSGLFNYEWANYGTDNDNPTDWYYGFRTISSGRRNT